MKIFNVAFLSLLVIAAALGWHNHRQLTDLRAIHGALVAQAAARGIPPDSDHPAASIRITKRPRRDRSAEARHAAAEFVTYAQEMTLYKWKPGAPDNATLNRIMDQTDRIMALDADQLKMVISELWTDKDIDGSIQGDLISSLIRRLAADHPQAALNIILDTPDLFDQVYRSSNGSGENAAILSLFKGFAKNNSGAAIGWFRKNTDKIPADLIQSAETGLIRGTQDTRTALQLVDDFGKDPKEFVPFLFVGTLKSPAERTASLAALREWSATVADEKTREEITTNALQYLVLGKSSDKVSFESTTSWIDGAGLSPEEIDQIADDLPFNVKVDEALQWSEWLAKSLPPEMAKNRMGRLFEKWIGHDYEGAGKWLASAPDGLVKTSAIIAYVQATVRGDPETAVKWLMTLPPSEDRKEAGWRVYADWPKTDSASWEAADAFANEHGLK